MRSPRGGDDEDTDWGRWWRNLGLGFDDAGVRTAWTAAGDGGDEEGGRCRCLNLSTSMGGTRSKVEGEDRHDLEPEGTHEDTRHEIYTGSGSRSSYPTSCLE
jgi:hypothetical protein